ncbi:MAG: galactokinase [Candidatus Binatia bacterium]|nr:galactokinase [Candidatus Binatia bacterium]
MSIVAKFRERFAAPAGVWRAPGRVNLIGEHTDYTGGLVLPIALPWETQVAAAARADGTLRVFAEAYQETVEFSLSTMPEQRQGHWSDYVLGVAHQLRRRKMLSTGADLLIESTLPPGAGLSSSAALEVAVASALLSLSEETLSNLELAKLCQEAEAGFVGTACGIMDMFVSITARERHATLIDCQQLTSRFVPLPEDLTILVVDTGVRHQLASGEYNQRRASCEEGLRRLRAEGLALVALADLPLADLERHEAVLGTLLYRRLRHVVSENARVRATVAALEAGNLDALRPLFAQSQASLRDDYEVSCPELDLLCEIATNQPGVLGARLTGGGFGGSVVVLTRSPGGLGDAILKAYRESAGLPGSVLEVVASPGASRLPLTAKN